MIRTLSLTLIGLVAVMGVALAGDCGTGTKTTAAMTASGGGAKAAVAKDIVDTAVEAGSFNTLVTAVQTADMVETLKGEGPFTVFAPNDAAFAKIPEEALAGLLKDQAGLTSVLTYHVVSGKVMAADVMKMNGQKVKTVNGKEITIRVSDGKVYVDNAQVIATDVKASNGVIHVIDTVVMPK